MTTTPRAQAAAMARKLLDGLVSFEDFALAFGDSSDEMIATLYELLEHQPQSGGLLGASPDDHAAYLREIDRVICSLEDAS